MEIEELLNKSRKIWGDNKCTLAEILVRLGVVYGDLCRIERDREESQKSFEVKELRKELGNIIFSTIRWCDDLGLAPEECLEEAVKCQEKFVEKLKERKL